MRVSVFPFLLLAAFPRAVLADSEVGRWLLLLYGQPGTVHCFPAAWFVDGKLLPSEVSVPEAFDRAVSGVGEVR